MPADPKWYDSADALLGTVPPPLLGSAGVASAPIVLRLYNDKDLAGADTLPPSQVFGRARTSSSGVALATGHPLVDRHMVEARRVQGLGGKTVTASAWEPLGAGRFITAPSLASGEGVEFEFRLVAPQDAQGDNPVLSLSHVIETGWTLPFGFTEIQGGGVILGIGDPLTTSIVIGENVVENPAGADTQIQIGYLTYIAAGAVYTILKQLVTIAASTATTARYVLISLATDGTVTLTDGVETGDPLTDDDKPATPTGEIAVAYIRRDDTAIVDSTDIENVWQASGYDVALDAPLAVTVGPGRGLVDNSLTFNQTAQAASLTASSVNSLWLLRSGQLDVTLTGLPPAGSRALLLAELTTDATTVTASRDLRRFIGHRLHTLRFQWLGILTTTDYRYAISPSDRPAYILPIRGLRATVGLPGTVSGQTRFLAQSDTGYDDTFASDLIDAAHAPEIPFAAVDPRAISSTPESHLIPAGARIRAWLSTVPAGADAEDATLDILVAEV